MGRDLLADRQHRTEGLHRPDRLGLVRIAASLRNKYFRAENDRESRHREH